MPEIFDASKQHQITKKKLTETKTVKDQTSHPHRHVDEYSLVMRQEKPSSNPLESFAPKPKKTAFDSQAREEQVVLLLRKHPITQLKQTVLTVLAAFFPFMIGFTPLLDSLPSRFQLGFFIGWYLLLIGFIFESFLVWFFNVYIITDERIIDVDFLSLVYKNISSAKIDNIEDITTTTGGVMASIVDYGTIKIQTAAERTEFEFEDVPHPAKVTSLLNEMILEEEREKIEGRVN